MANVYVLPISAHFVYPLLFRCFVVARVFQQYHGFRGAVFYVEEEVQWKREADEIEVR